MGQVDADEKRAEANQIKRDRADHSRWVGKLNAALPLISLIIAGLSLAATIAQTYNYRRNIESIQKNVLRAENLRSCKEVIEVFFDFRLKLEQLNATASGQGSAAGQGSSTDAARLALKSVVYKFGAAGTFLANFAPETARARYAALAWDMLDIVDKAGTFEIGQFETRFARIDDAFSAMNSDCVRSASFDNSL